MTSMENRPGYVEILRELIRYQMLHLIEQLSDTGEECFLVSAVRDDETPHLIGSAKGLGYMKGFTGVQEGFIHYLQKHACTPRSYTVSKTEADIPESHQVPRSDGGLESCQVSKSDEMKPESHQPSNLDANIQNPSVSDVCAPGPDQTSVSDANISEMSRSDANASVSHEVSRSNISIPESDEASQSDPSIPVPHQALVSVEEQQTKCKLNCTVLSCADETCGNEPLRSHPTDIQTSEQTSALKIEKLDEDEHVATSDNSFGSNPQSPEQDVAQEQPQDLPIFFASPLNFQTLNTPYDETNKENQNEGLTHNALDEMSNSNESFIIDVITDEVVNLKKGAAPEITSTERSVETETNNEGNRSLEMSAETVDSDDDESDTDYDDNDFEEEEIIPKLINDFKDQEKVTETMNTSEGNHMDTGCAKKNRNTYRYAENFNFKSLTGLEGETNSAKTNLATLRNETVESEMEISSHNGEDIDQVQVFVTGNIKSGQVFKFRNNLYRLSEIVSPNDMVCRYCKKDCRSIKEVREHEGKHSKKYICYKCDRKFESQVNLRVHNTTCFEIPEFVKDFFKANPNCSPRKYLPLDKKRKSKSAVKRNLARDIPTSENKVSSSTFEKSAVEGVLLDKNSQKQVFECKVCLKKFKFRISLNQHHCKALSDKAGKAGSTANVVECKLDTTDRAEQLVGDELGKEEVGKKSWNYQELLEWPITNKTCPFPNCGRKFPSNGHVREHLVAHTTERPFKCNECIKCFKYKRDLTRHKKDGYWCKHTQRKSKAANKILARRGSVTMSKGILQGGGASLLAPASLVKKTRVRGPALGSLKIVAKQKAGKLKSNIKKGSKITNTKVAMHKDSDDRIRKYKCPYCEKRYLTNGHLSEHVVKHTLVKNFKCSLCGEELLQRSQFPGHKKQCESKNPGEVSKMLRLNAKQRRRGKVCKELNLETGHDVSCVKKKSDKIGAKKKTLKSDFEMIGSGDSGIEKSYAGAGIEGDHCAVDKAQSCSESENDNNMKDVTETEVRSSEFESVSGVERAEQMQQNLAEHARLDDEPGLSQAPSPPPSYICSICGARFLTAFDILDHNNKMHG